MVAKLKELLSFDPNPRYIYENLYYLCYKGNGESKETSVLRKLNFSWNNIIMRGKCKLPKLIKTKSVPGSFYEEKGLIFTEMPGAT